MLKAVQHADGVPNTAANPRLVVSNALALTARNRGPSRASRLGFAVEGERRTFTIAPAESMTDPSNRRRGAPPEPDCSSEEPSRTSRKGDVLLVGCPEAKEVFSAVRSDPCTPRLESPSRRMTPAPVITVLGSKKSNPGVGAALKPAEPRWST